MIIDRSVVVDDAGNHEKYERQEFGNWCRSCWSWLLGEELSPQFF
jgi:hypothetical protein